MNLIYFKSKSYLILTQITGIVINILYSYDGPFLLALNSGIFTSSFYNNINSKYKLILIYKVYNDLNYNSNKKVLIHIIFDYDKTLFDLYYFERLGSYLFFNYFFSKGNSFKQAFFHNNEQTFINTEYEFNIYYLP